MMTRYEGQSFRKAYPEIMWLAATLGSKKMNNLLVALGNLGENDVKEFLNLLDTLGVPKGSDARAYCLWHFQDLLIFQASLAGKVLSEHLYELYSDDYKDIPKLSDYRKKKSGFIV